jgi:hypothetical protein
MQSYKIKKKINQKNNNETICKEYRYWVNVQGDNVVEVHVGRSKSD